MILDLKGFSFIQEADWITWPFPAFEYFTINGHDIPLGQLQDS